MERKEFEKQFKRISRKQGFVDIFISREERIRADDYYDIISDYVKDDMVGFVRREDNHELFVANLKLKKIKKLN